MRDCTKVQEVTASTRFNFKRSSCAKRAGRCGTDRVVQFEVIMLQYQNNYFGNFGSFLSFGSEFSYMHCGKVGSDRCAFVQSSETPGAFSPSVCVPQHARTALCPVPHCTTVKVFFVL